MLLRCPVFGPHPPEWRATLPSWAGWQGQRPLLDARSIIWAGGSLREPGAPSGGRHEATPFDAAEYPYDEQAVVECINELQEMEAKFRPRVVRGRSDPGRQPRD